MEYEPQPKILGYKTMCSTHGFLGEVVSLKMALDLFTAHQTNELTGCGGYKIIPVFEKPETNIELFDIIPP